MSNNRGSINEYDLVWGAPAGYEVKQPPQGQYPPPHSITQMKLLRKLRIREGTTAVVTLDGAYEETLRAGGVALGKYTLLKRCEIYWVDMRDRELTVQTSKELRIMDPVPQDVDLTVSVKYRVSEPRVVALEVKNPITTLYDYTIEAMRQACSQFKFQDFLGGGSAGNSIYQHLKNRNVENYLGIELLDVLTSSISGADRAVSLMQNQGLAPAETQVELTTEAMRKNQELQFEMREAEIRNDIASMLQLSPAYVAQFLPEMYESIYGNRALTDQARLEGLIELAKIGVIDAAALSGLGDVAGTLGRSLGVEPQRPANALPGYVPDQPYGAMGARGRLLQETNTLRENGFEVSLQEDEDNYYVEVRMSLDEGHELNAYFVCTQSYPQDPPQLIVEHDGQQEAFNSINVQNWDYRKSLSEILKEIVSYYWE
jgi:regulator of protease activity HflC (stomatin/prohibitin superfamily)